MRSPTNRRLRDRIRVGSVAAIFGLTVCAVAGCNIVGPAFFLVNGPGKVDAAYELEADTPTVIFIDDPANKVTRRRYRGIIANTAQELLLRKDVVSEGKMIDGRSAITFAATATTDDPHSIQDIGEIVRADTVVYALVSDFRTAGLAGDPSPTVTMHVKVIDVVTGERLWPEEPEGFRLNLMMPAAPSNLPSSRAEQAKTEERLAEFAGVGLSQLFYSVERPQSVRLP